MGWWCVFQQKNKTNLGQINKERSKSMDCPNRYTFVRAYSSKLLIQMSNMSVSLRESETVTDNTEQSSLDL